MPFEVNSLLMLVGLILILISLVALVKKIKRKLRKWSYGGLFSGNAIYLSSLIEGGLKEVDLIWTTLFPTIFLIIGLLIWKTKRGRLGRVITFLGTIGLINGFIMNINYLG